jgi:hypothetical protein
MGSFANQMKGFTEDLKSSISGREDALSRIHHATEQLLDEAREFVGTVASARCEMATELRAGLTADRDAQREAAEALRHEHRASHRQMSDRLRTSLRKNQTALHKSVRDMQHQFTKARHHLAVDLHKAANNWRHFAAQR